MRASVAGLLALLVVAGAVLTIGPWLDVRLLDAVFTFNREAGPLPVTTDVVVVGIDDAFVDAIEEPLTLSHHQIATFLRSASAAGAKVIALDIVLPEKRYDQIYSTSHPDSDYHRSLLAGLIETRQRSQVVLAKVWDHDRHRYLVPQLDIVAIMGQESIASALVCFDADQRVRAYPQPSCQPDRTSHTLSSAVAAAMGRQQNWAGLINYQIGPAFRYVPLQEVLAMARAGDQAGLERMFAGRAVLVGSVQSDVDIVAVPVPLAQWLPNAHRVPGVLVHAQAVRSMLNQGLVAVVPAWFTVLGTLLACLFWFRPGAQGKLALMLALSAFLLLASHAMLRNGIWIAPAAILLAGWTMTLARIAWQGWQHYRDKQRLSRTFSGYVSPSVLHQILDGALDARNEGVKLPVCVLFSDIRGFTAMSERLPAEQVVALLNRYFARMTAAVHRHGGTVDKFIGDGMMAFFGAPNALEQPELAALSAARDMLAELAVLNAALAIEGQAALAIGIGIHSGPAVIGHIGSAERHEYTAIGDTVNVAARLEGLCAALGYPIICSGAVAQSLGAPLDSLGEHPLKGHTAVPVFGTR